MIFLFEDKADRRRDFGWSDEKILLYSKSLTLIDNIEKLCKLESRFYEAGNVLILHESFSNSVDSSFNDIVNGFYRKFDETQDFVFKVRFSGSNPGRDIGNNCCSLTPYILYQNLESFIAKAEENIDLRYLLYGNKPEKEERLRKLAIQVAKKNVLGEDGSIFEPKASGKKILFFINNRDKDILIEPPFADAETFQLSKMADDCQCCEMIKSNLTATLYDAIYIPLSYKKVLSDFMGFRLAMLIRLSKTINRSTPIFIYGEAEPSDYMDNECVDILKMKGVHMVHSDNGSLFGTLDYYDRISDEDFLIGVRNIHLNVPTDIGDNHSVANKWGIYRWSYALEEIDRDIRQVRTDVENTLYFIYLSALYPIDNLSTIGKVLLKVEKNLYQEQLNVLLVDDDADNGWNALMYRLVGSENNIDYECINGGFKSMTREAIIEKVINKIKKDKHNVVILDFRLHKDDFRSKIEDITGYKLLERIKAENRGIQVIAFSATNKIWNLLELQKKEVDGFVLKESPQNSVDSNFTKHTIANFVKLLSECSSHTYKIDICSKIKELIEHLRLLKKNHKANPEYVSAATTFLSMVENSLFSKDLKNMEASVFVNLYQILELTIQELIGYNKDKDIYCFKRELSSAQIKKAGDDGRLIEGKYSDIHARDKICNLLYAIKEPANMVKDIVDKRNSYIHADLTETGSRLYKFTVLDVEQIFDVVYKIIIKRKEI